MRRIVSKYELGELLGKGAYSEVFKARHLDNGNTFAVKVIGNKVLADNEKVKECINNELAIHNILEPGPHIVRFHELLQTKNNCYFVYEFCEGGTLHDLLRREGPLEEKRALEIFCQLVAGLKVLRKHNIMHRDLKPENVLIKEGNFKLADFGFCKELGSETMTRTMLGSPLYMAPEILRGEPYSVNADIWSVGVILF
jgi:serine/threonine protein kinase